MKMYMKTLKILGLLLSFLSKFVCSTQYGPDPWHYESNSLQESGSNIPSDLQNLPFTRPDKQIDLAQHDWFLKRIIAIILKGGVVKKNVEDSTVQIHMHMKFSEKEWNLLNDYSQYKEVLTDEMLRRTVGYMVESIYKPSFTEKMTQAWNDYIQEYLSRYKMEIMYTLIIISILMTSWYLYHNVSRKHILLLSFFGIYVYEACISYMESEKQEYEKFLQAVNTCKWSFWSSDCDLPQPDPLVFVKHMHPLKIVIRIFTTFITEPMILISSTLQTIVHGLTGHLWYPLNSILYGILTSLLIVLFTGLLLILLIMIFSNYVLNIPLNFGFLGILNFFVPQRNRELFSETSTLPGDISNNNDRLSGKNLDKFLNIFAHYVDKSGKHIDPSVPSVSSVNENREHSSLKRSSSVGRLTEFVRSPYNMDERITPYMKNRRKDLGNGDN